MADAGEVFLFAKYPILPQAREWTRQSHYSLGELLADPAFERARRRAVTRVQGSLQTDGIRDEPFTTGVGAESELFSYPLARALVATVEDSYLRQRYAVAESKLLSRRLQDESPEVLLSVAQATGLPAEPASDGSFEVPFVDFLRNAPGRDTSWKLVNQRLSRGRVLLRGEQLVRLTEEALKNRLLDELEELERPGRVLSEAFRRDLDEIRTMVAAHRARFATDLSGPVRPEAFPPCMKAIFGGMAAHVNVPHMGRFAIVAFLHTLGMTSEDILRYFSQVPDFDASKSRYQIEHITGQIGATQYTPPSCSTMQTYGICPLDERDEICLYQIHHPLAYYRKRVRFLPPPAPAKPAAPEVKNGGTPRPEPGQ